MTPRFSVVYDFSFYRYFLVLNLDDVQKHKETVKGQTKPKSSKK